MVDKYVPEGFLLDTCTTDEDGTQKTFFELPIPKRTRFTPEVVVGGVWKLMIELEASNGRLLYALRPNFETHLFDAELIADDVDAGPAE